MSHSVSISIADAMRVVMVIGFSFILGLTVAIFAIYLLANKHIKRVDPTRVGALPVYAASIAISYILLSAFSVAEIQGYYGSPLTYRAPLGLVAMCFGLWALVNLLRFENSRLDVRDETVTITGTPGGDE